MWLVSAFYQKLICLKGLDYLAQGGFRLGQGRCSACLCYVIETHWAVTQRPASVWPFCFTCYGQVHYCFNSWHPGKGKAGFLLILCCFTSTYSQLHGVLLESIWRDVPGKASLCGTIQCSFVCRLLTEASQPCWMNLRCFDLFFGESLYDLSYLFSLPAFPFGFLLKNKAIWIKLLCIGISNINECCFKALSHLGHEMTTGHHSCASRRICVALGLFAISLNRSALWKGHLFPYISYYKSKNNEQLEGQHKAAVLCVLGDPMCSLAIETGLL